MNRPHARLKAELQDTFLWRTDPELDDWYADDSGWLRSRLVVGELGEALANLHETDGVTAVMGTESRGTAIACLTAMYLGVGVIEVRKSPERASHEDVWFTQRTGPDYRDRHLELAIRRSTLSAADHVLFVDDWIATGGQARACQQLVEQAGATWIGASVIVDSLSDNRIRRDLSVGSLLNVRDL